MLDFCLICVLVCVCVHVHTHMPLGVSKRVRGLPTKYSPLYFLSKYLLVDYLIIFSFAVQTLVTFFKTMHLN